MKMPALFSVLPALLSAPLGAASSEIVVIHACRCLGLKRAQPAWPAACCALKGRRDQACGFKQVVMVQKKLKW